MQKEGVLQSMRLPRRTSVAYLLVLLVSLVLPRLGLHDYDMHIAVTVLIYVMLASSLNLITGYAGQISVGHAAFFCIGAYTSALLTLKAGWNSWFGLVAGGILSGLAGVALGVPVLRLRGPYLVIATLGFAEIVRHTVINWIALTRGPMGLPGVPPMSPVNMGYLVLRFESKTSYYYMLLAFVVVLLYITWNLVNSRIGRAWRAIRENPMAAEVMGVDLAFYRVLAFAAGAMIAGLAGGFYVHYVGYVSPDSFTVRESVHILTIVAVGGMGTFSGPIVGALLINTLLQYLRFLADYRLILYGVLLFLVSVFFPGGIVGEATKYLRAWKARFAKQLDETTGT